MEKLTQADLLNIYEYEKQRDEFRKNIMSVKQQRRFQLGPYIMMTFENRKTIQFQVQEMMRAERMVSDAQIQSELDVYNPLIPEGNELSATLFIEVTESEQIRPVLNQFIGLTDGKSVWFQIGGQRVYAQFEEGREEEDKISSVHYLKFRFSPKDHDLFKRPEETAALVIDYGDYHYSSALDVDIRTTLLSDLE